MLFLASVIPARVQYTKETLGPTGRSNIWRQSSASKVDPQAATAEMCCKDLK